MEQEITQLEEKMAGLLEWKRSRDSERLVFPIDAHSRKTLDYWHTKFFDGLILATGKVLPGTFAYITELISFGIETTLNGEKRVVLGMFELKPFTVNFTTDVITSTNGAHNLKNGDLIAVTTTDTLPGNLSSIAEYYVINATATTFKVSLTRGGSAVNIADNGFGVQYYALQ